MREIIVLVLSFIFSIGYAAEPPLPLPAEKAFVFSAVLHHGNQLVFEWNIAPGYYLYRNQLTLKPAPVNGVKLGKINWPAGQVKQDVLHGTYQAYTGVVKVFVPIVGKAKGVLNLNVDYQGCSSAGFCYTPIKKTLTVDLSRISAPYNLTQYVQTIGAMTKAHALDDNAYDTFFAGHNLLVVVLSFLGLGLLLAFTPCVLPMIPILSGIIVGQGKKITAKKSFFLSLSYVSGMAITYAIVGIVIALIGSGIQAQLQKTWVLILFSGFFILLALSLFGFYELQLPMRLRSLITNLSNRQRGGTYIGVFLMGSLSTLIVSPCVSAPLEGGGR